MGLGWCRDCIAGGCSLGAWASPASVPAPAFRTFVLETKQPHLDTKLYGVALSLHTVVGEVAGATVTAPTVLVLLTRFPVRALCASDPFATFPIPLMYRPSPPLLSSG